MEDTKSLLVMVLQKVFHSRPKIIEDTYQLIYNYNNGNKDKNEYEKTLKTICELMNDELPSEILVYLLTLVDMPQQGGCQLPIVEKMQKTHNCLPERVRPHLLEYLRHCGKKSISPPNTTSESIFARIKEKSEEVITDEKVMEGLSDDNKLNASCNSSEKDLIDTSVSNSNGHKSFVKPITKRTRGKKKITSNGQNLVKNNPVMSLLDITANFVVINEQNLKRMYKKKQKLAWKMIYSCKGNDLQQCYDVVKDLNKKTKLLRMIEDDNITEDAFFEEYKQSDVFLRERHMMEVVTRDPFEISKELTNSVKNFISRNTQ